MKTVAIIQARMGSTRLPGKVMRRLCGVSVLGHVVERVRRCASIDDIVVATTTAKGDDVIVAESHAMGVSAFRGSEEDVLGRYYGAAIHAKAGLIVRITSDCPLIDPDVLQQMLECYRGLQKAGRRIDCLTNTVARTFPRGLDAEIFPMATLHAAHRLASAPEEREHVTPYIYRHPERFSIEHFAQEVDHSHHRWTLDTPEDWELIERIYAELGSQGGKFSTEDVIGLLMQRPELVAINAKVKQKQLGEPQSDLKAAGRE